MDSQLKDLPETGMNSPNFGDEVEHKSRKYGGALKTCGVGRGAHDQAHMAASLQGRR